MNIRVATSWRELNDWQLEEIAHLYLNTSVEDFENAYFKMILILFQRKNTFWAKFRLHRIIRQVPFSTLVKYGSFLIEKTDFHTFPEIKGLVKPADRIANFTAKHYSVCDAFFDAWEKDPSKLNLRRMVASLYLLEENPNFDELLLPKIAEITDKISSKKRARIALAYKFTRFHIYEKYPIIFPQKKENEDNSFQPLFQKKEPKYISFDKVINSLVFSDEQPLGTKQEADNTRVYHFLNILTESIIRHREKEKMYAHK